MARTKKELIELLAAANEMLEKYYKADKSFTATFDNILERLEIEFEERIALRKKLSEARAALSDAHGKNQEILNKFSEMELALKVSLDRLGDIRQKIQITKDLIFEEADTSRELNERLHEIAKSADVTLIPVPRLRAAPYQIGN